MKTFWNFWFVLLDKLILIRRESAQRVLLRESPFDSPVSKSISSHTPREQYQGVFTNIEHFIEIENTYCSVLFESFNITLCPEIFFQW